MNGFRKEMNLYYMFLNIEFWNTTIKKMSSIQCIWRSSVRLAGEDIFINDNLK